VVVVKPATGVSTRTVAVGRTLVEVAPTLGAVKVGSSPPVARVAAEVATWATVIGFAVTARALESLVTYVSAAAAYVPTTVRFKFEYLTVARRVKIVQTLALEAIVVQATDRDGSSPPVLTANVALVNAEVAALAGTVDIRPKPNDATATSAMRFRSVFVDMFFLSMSRSRESL
jgi:hypothetical protein